VTKQTVVIIQAYHFCQLHKKFHQTFRCQGYIHIQRSLLGIISVDFDMTGQILINILHSSNTWEKWE